ncbi:E3 ubiquitin-protein ligase MARCHF3-like [Ixodes scapularis]|uniref:E3 ubiquitin-protein ligase MARCHF3-like n=1 Tax=Ixodes scapularis TaxID=6945 RepID=UPI00116181B1|nr:E3 ubiquitin-protein ligase MARCHF3-like [Ixodes scapularis]
MPSEGRAEEGSPNDGSENETSSMGEVSMCRICFRGARAGNLLSPCNCKGTIGLVHKECLEEWLSRRNTDECNICSFQFKVERTPKSIWDWLRDPGSQANRWYILVDMSLSLFGAVMLLVSAWLSAVEIISGISSVLGCVLIVIIVVLAGLICVADIYLMVRHHHQALLQWRQNNWGVRLVLPASEILAGSPPGAMNAHPPQSPPPSAGAALAPAPGTSPQGAAALPRA